MKRDRLDPPKIRWLVEPTFDDDGVQRSAGLDELGREHGDPVPMSPPVGLSTHQGDRLHESLRQLVRQELFNRAVEEEGFESFEESEDFEVEDDYFPVDPKTPWEEVFDPPPGGAEGRSPTLAGEAPNGQNRAPEEATGQPSASRRVSADSASESTSAPLVETPTAAVGSSGTDGQRYTEAAGGQSGRPDQFVQKPQQSTSRRRL